MVFYIEESLYEKILSKKRIWRWGDMTKFLTEAVREKVEKNECMQINELVCNEGHKRGL